MISLVLSLLLIFSPVENSSKVRKKMNKKTPPGTVWVRDSLYIDANEVRNVDYREYLFSLNKSKKKNSTEYKNAMLDTLVWRTPEAYNEPYVELYLRHPAYKEYPIVGVSHKQAIDFCNWRTDRVNESIYKKINKLNILIEINADTIPKYVQYRLPTVEEWEFSAKGGLRSVDFPWGGPYMQNAKGCYLCNFNRISDANIMLGDSVNKYVVAKNIDRGSGFLISDNATITAPATSYEPNNYGIYNISGNVAEMVSTKGVAKGGSWKLPGYYCRIDKQTTYTKPQDDLGFRCVCDKLLDWK